ncbi:RHS repeat domain-containing protein [Bremerella cremea]|uniref:RHS repeat domain-containing protein n=1 Tax=Bremerella cremea TaxID=1031537 RepID=UPI001314EF99|nr:RHS repeat-associated core domain-containing protein [Bremerella cremea]
MDDAGDVEHRLLWGANVDQLLADENSSGDVYWALTDHLGSIRDWAEYDDLTDTTYDANHITYDANHITYDAFGNVLSETNATLDIANFGFTARYFDEATGLQYNTNRWYNAQLGRWMSQDPIGFEGGDENLYRYVGNGPTIATDPSGLAEGWEWNWHHLLDRAIFNEDFITKYGLKININSAKYGWMLRAKDHTWTGGIHPEGWSRDWKEWIRQYEEKGTIITKEMIDDQLKEMVSKYKLDELGFPAKYSYEQADKAYKVAERMARSRAAKEAAEKLTKKGLRKIGKKALGAIPCIGAVTIPFALQENVQAKGIFCGTVQTGLENTPVVEWVLLAGGDEYIPTDEQVRNKMQDPNNLRPGQEERDNAERGYDRLNAEWIMEQLRKQEEYKNSLQSKYDEYESDMKMLRFMEARLASGEINRNGNESEYEAAIRKDVENLRRKWGI